MANIYRFYISKKLRNLKIGEILRCCRYYPKCRECPLNYYCGGFVKDMNLDKNLDHKVYLKFKYNKHE